MKRNGYHMILRANLRRLRQRNSLRAAECGDKNYADKEW